ncbi:MAG: hypothetical protein P9M07_05760 [Candidatus Aceula meridiana]|nr:hypothetical protein [Candidatus Aceula meridiana]
MFRKRILNFGLIVALLVSVPVAIVYANDMNFAGNSEYRDKHMTPEQKRKREIGQRREKLRTMQEKVKSEVFYLRSNMWFEKEKNFVSTNFHRGTIIPAGTEVRVEKFGGDKIKFTVVSENRAYTYTRAAKHSKIDLYELFDRYFSNDNPLKGDFKKLSSQEKENIENGKIEVGMSKEAVLMAYGYPPTHKTPSIDLDLWTYWEGRAKSFTVHFRNDKVSEINGYTFE